MTLELPRWGDLLLAHARNSKLRVVLIAPFIKERTLARVLSAIPPTVGLIDIVTRWRPEEVAAGVSDLEILDLVAGRAGARLFLHPHLHAKIFLLDAEALVGSANLTDTALGWREPANIEYVVGAGNETEAVRAFADRLIAIGQPADRHIQSVVRRAADILIERGLVMPAQDLGDHPKFGAEFWLPTCPRPDLLYRVYVGSIGQRLLEEPLAMARDDLAFLAPPHGLAEPDFTQFVAAMLLQVRCIAELDAMTDQGINDVDAAAVIAGRMREGHNLDPGALWSVLKDWLQQFYPNTYERIPAGEIFRKRRRLF